MDIPEKRKVSTNKTKSRKKKPDDIIFNNDGTINKGIQMWDILAIRKWKSDV